MDGITRIDFYCRKCKKNTGISYILSGDDSEYAAAGIIMKCPTHKCMRTITFKKITEGDVLAHIDSRGRLYV